MTGVQVRNRVSHKSDKKEQKSMNTGEGKRRNEGWVERLKTTSHLVMTDLSCIVCFWTVGSFQLCCILTELCGWVLLAQALQEHSFPTLSSCYSLPIQTNIPIQSPFMLM